jgi:FlaA1/EpsC-like NDP-sugar epimerase
LAGIYAGIIAASFYAAYEVRFEFLVPPEYQVERLRLLPWVIGLKIGALALFRQFGTLMTYFSLPDLNRLVGAMALASGALLLPRSLGWIEFGAPRGVLLVDFMLAFGVLCGGRLAVRLYRERLSGVGRTPGRALQRIAIIGAGDVGARLANDFLSYPARGFRPVMFLDDDETKRGKHVHGVVVEGRPELLAEQRVAKELDKAVIAMPSAPARRIREVLAAAATHGLKVEIVPSFEELAAGRVKTSRVRPVEVQDLLGRSAVEIDSAGIRQALAGKVMLVTGAGGSIGSELCRQISALNPERLLLVEQSEAALFLIEQELNEQGFGGAITPLVADVLDRPRMESIFRRYGPQVVFHAAAHKHVFLMERQPAEAIRNNAFGSRQLAEIAAAHGVEAFTLISTDKAINPTNVMGATKRLADLLVMDGAVEQVGKGGGAGVGEGLRVKGDEAILGGGNCLGASFSSTSSTAYRTAPRFCAVRFGNVLGSSGSVIPIFKRQIDQGGPVTVTHPDVTRYFMTIPEAVGLVLQSFVLGGGEGRMTGEMAKSNETGKTAATGNFGNSVESGLGRQRIGGGGDIFVLDMGQPVKIVDLARQMIELSGYRVGEDIEIVFSGLKPGEKLFEELRHHTEEYAPTAHPRIMRFRGAGEVDKAALGDLEAELHSQDANTLKRRLQRLVPEYKPHWE